MAQHAWQPITCGMKENNELADFYTVLCYTAGIVDYELGFVYLCQQYTVVISAMSHLIPANS
jgi:hypothetical protein